MDNIFVRHLTLETMIGLFPWEWEVRQRLLINLDIGADIQRAAVTGDFTAYG